VGVPASSSQESLHWRGQLAASTGRPGSQPAAAGPPSASAGPSTGIKLWPQSVRTLSVAPAAHVWQNNLIIETHLLCCCTCRRLFKPDCFRVKTQAATYRQSHECLTPGWLGNRVNDHCWQVHASHHATCAFGTRQHIIIPSPMRRDRCTNIEGYIYSAEYDVLEY
jgi:hypothetical protein